MSLFSYLFINFGAKFSDMEYKETEIKGVWIIEPKVFNDARGYFFEAWKQDDFDKHIGYHTSFIQDNQSKSSYGVLRGLHYQKGKVSARASRPCC